MFNFLKAKKWPSYMMASLMLVSTLSGGIAVKADSAASSQPVIDLTGDVKAADSNGQVKLQILSTTDSHGRFIPYDYAINTADNSGSLTQIYTAVKNFRSQNPNTILVDAGDIIQDNSASLFLNDTVNPMMLAMNEIGYDALTLGNHEFNYGIPVLKKNILDQFKGVSLCGNVYNTDGSRLAAPYTVIEKAGVKVGLIGMVTPNITRWDSANLQGYKITNPVDETKAAIAELKKQNVDVIVAVQHMGETEEYNEPGSGAMDVLNACPEITAFIGAHFHVRIVGDYFYQGKMYSYDGTKVTVTAMDGTTSPSTMDAYNAAKANGTIFVEANKWAKTISQLNLTLTKDANGKYTIADKANDITSAAYDMTSKVNGKTVVNYDEDQKLNSELKSYSQRAIDDANVAIGTLKGGDLAPANEVTGITQAKLQPTAMIDLINRVQMYYGKQVAGGHDIDVAAAAAFSDTANAKEGTIKRCDTAKIYQYDNTLYVLKVTGSQLKKYMEWSVTYYNKYNPGDLTVSFNKSIPGYNYDMFTGIKYNVDISKDPGSRIVNITKMDGTPIKDTDVLYLAVNNYRAGTQLLTPGTVFKAGEALPVLVGKSEQTNGLGDGRIRDLIGKYINDVKGGTITPVYENNWSMIGNNWNPVERALAVKYVNSGAISLAGIAGEQTSSNSKAVTWNDVKAAMNADTAKTIEVSGTNVAKDVLSVIKGKDQSIAINANGTTWTFNGKDITSDPANDIDLTLKTVSNDLKNKEAAKVKAVTGKDLAIAPFSFNYDGALPGKAAIKVLIGKDWANKNVNICRYYSDTNKYDLVDTVKVDGDGYIVFNTNHCSDYFAVDTSAAGSLPKTGSMLDFNSVVGLGAILICLGAVILLAKRNKKTA